MLLSFQGELDQWSMQYDVQDASPAAFQDVDFCLVNGYSAVQSTP